MKILSIQELMQTPVCMMTGEQLAMLLSNLKLLMGNTIENKTEATPPKHLAYGIRGIADTFGCSIPTANRIKKSGVIDDAISQTGRKIVVDVDKALALVKQQKHDVLCK